MPVYWCRTPAGEFVICNPFTNRVVAPAKTALGLRGRVPRRRFFPLGFARQALADEARVSYRFMPAHARHRMCSAQLSLFKHLAHSPRRIITGARPVERRTTAILFFPCPTG